MKAIGIAAFSLLCATSALFSASPARAWGNEGHEIVCVIAWEEMKPATREAVMSILKVTDRADFAESCIWADQYRQSHRETSSWHFVNVPRGSTEVVLKRDCPGRGVSCAVRAINVFSSRIKNATDDNDASEPLMFLSHFVGDVHQPLHVSYEDDHGGNSIKGKFQNQQPKENHQTNLHKVWDTEMISTEGKDAEDVADALRAKITPEMRTAWKAEMNTLKWANESLAITISAKAKYTNAQADGSTWNDQYTKDNLPTVEQRLEMAGVRLATLLDTVLKDDQ